MSVLSFHQPAMAYFTSIREETKQLFILTFFLVVGFMLTMRLSC